MDLFSVSCFIVVLTTCVCGRAYACICNLIVYAEVFNLKKSLNKYLPNVAVVMGDVAVVLGDVAVPVVAVAAAESKLQWCLK